MSMLSGLRSALLIGASIAVPLFALPASVRAESYPDKPIRVIIPFGAGGITDIAGRLVGKFLSEELKQQVVIDNKPGAGGVIAAQTLSQAQPDGYTLMLGTVGTQVVNKMIYRKLNYDPAAMAPVSLISNSPYVMAINGIEGVNDLAGLTKYAKANPGKLNFGSAGNGSSPHLGIELYKLATQTRIVHIPFKSGAEAVNAAMAGQVQIVIDAIPVIMPQVKAGRLKVLALAAAKRSGAAPDVKTSAEQGLPDFQVGSWNALVAPPGTPADRVAVLEAAVSRTMARPELVKQLTEMGIDILPSGTKAYEEFVRNETRKWSRVTEAAGTKLD